MLIEVKVEVKVKVEQVQEFKGVPILESRGMMGYLEHIAFLPNH